MAHISSQISSDSDIKMKQAPSRATIDFIRQFARSCVSVPGLALGSMVIN